MQARDCARGAAPTPHTAKGREGEMTEKQKKTEQ